MKWVLQDKKRKKYSLKRLLRSFRYAFCGIFKAYKTEQNLLIHTIAMILILCLSWYLKISYIELAIVVLAIGLVISLELVNTSIENTVDMAMPNIHPLAKNAKDIASGAVLVSCFTAIAIAIIIFVPKLLNLF